MYEFRDQHVATLGVELLVHRNPDCVARGINPFDHGSAMHTDLWKTEGLKQALDLHGFDLAFGGARRDEEKSRAKERVFSIRSAQHRWDPKQQRPELWPLYNARTAPGESVRVFPLSNWTELDVWQYIHLEQIPIVPLYFADQATGRRARRHVDHGRRRPHAAQPLARCPRCAASASARSAAIRSPARSRARPATLPEIIQEMLLTTSSERQGRVIDHDSSGSMEKKKQEGYF